jgi:hypothetical protein
MSDLISREDAINKLYNINPSEDFLFIDAIVDMLENLPAIRTIETLNELPSAEQKEFEWCHNCKEYDQEQHCCHRWTKVIRQTVEELKAEKQEITAKVKEGWGFAICESCKKRVYQNDIYCSHCGARLEWE